MKKVTVLIPTLNSIKFMKECIESVINQTLQEIEIIIVDAGSTDGTLELIESYQKEDARIQIVHSEKKSYGYQLNKGIALAKGSYIGVVESDDVIDPDMYAVLLDAAEKENLDFAKGSFINYAITEDGQEMIIPDVSIPKNIIGKVIKPSEHKSLLIEDFYLWRGLYKADFLKENQIIFHESPGAAYQDIGFLYQTFTLAQRVIYLDKCVYKYRRNNSNSSTYSLKAFSYLAKEYSFILDELIINKELYNQWSTYFYYKMLMQCRARLRLLAFHDGDINVVKKDIEYLQGLLSKAYENREIDISVWDMQSQMEFFMFVRDIFVYEEYYKIQISAQKQCINNMIKTLKNFSEITLVSDSKILSFIYALLNRNKINTIVNICDNDRAKWGNLRMGVKITSVEKACEDRQNRAYIISHSGAKKELKQQLNSFGVEDEQIYIYDLGCDWLFLS